MRGEFTEATSRFEAALDLARRLNLVVLQGRALYRLGDVKRAQGRLASATLLLNEALDLLRKNGTKLNQMEALSALAECKARQSDLPGAERLLTEATSLNGEHSQTWRARAWVEHQRGQKKKALDLLSRALATPPGDDPEHRQELSRLITTWGRGP